MNFCLLDARSPWYKTHGLSSLQVFHNYMILFFHLLKTLVGHPCGLCLMYCISTFRSLSFQIISHPEAHQVCLLTWIHQKFHVLGSATISVSYFWDFFLHLILFFFQHLLWTQSALFPPLCYIPAFLFGFSSVQVLPVVPTYSCKQEQGISDSIIQFNYVVMFFWILFSCLILETSHTSRSIGTHAAYFKYVAY